MENLGSIYANVIQNKLPKDYPEQYMPEDGLCTTCNRLVKHHPGVERAIAANGYTKEVDGRIQYKVGIPFCICPTKQDRVEQVQRSAHLPGNVKTFGSFVQRPGTEEAFKAAFDFAFDRGPNILVLSGNPGAGKSHLLQAIGWQCIDAGIVCRYELVADLLERLRATYNPNAPETYDDAIAIYRQATYLLLDDIGLEKPSEWVREKITALVDERYRNGRRLAVATNLDQRQMEAAMGNRLASRLWDTSNAVVRINCGDYRSL